MRKISSDKYIVAGVITLLVFSLGLTLGLIFEDYRYNVIQDINQEQDTKYLSLQLQYLFLNSFGNHNICPSLSTSLKAATTDLDESLSRVVSKAEEDSSAVRDKLIQRRYIIDNLRLWLLARESKNKCDLQIVPILYFYTEKCSSCPNQGTVLTYFKRLFQEKVLVFPINLDLRKEEPMVEIIVGQFNISKVPTIVINNKKYEGVVQQDQLQKIICNSLDEDVNCDQ